VVDISICLIYNKNYILCCYQLKSNLSTSFLLKYKNETYPNIHNLQLYSKNHSWGYKMITITQICKHDLEGLKLLYDKGFEGTNTDFIKMNEVYNWMKDNPDYTVLCAKFEDEIVGSLMGVANRELIGECRPFMVIENVVVPDKHRRMGIGKLLMDGIEKVAVEKNCSFMMLISRMHRKGAHKFYEAVGFSGDVAKGFKKYLNNL
jgi:ribosomal protein S18 acetylase RimI-like enzyme